MILPLLKGNTHSVPLYTASMRFAESHKHLFAFRLKGDFDFQFLNNVGPVKHKGDSCLVPLSKSTYQVSLSTEFDT